MQPDQRGDCMDSEKRQDFQNTKELAAAAEYGIDVAALMDNVQKTPAELIRRHQIALDTAEKLRKAGKNLEIKK
jgi:hypothetical protein